LQPLCKQFDSFLGVIVGEQLSASATSVGALFSQTTFTIPPFQREYSWRKSEIRDFWEDLAGALSQGDYFLGLIVLTDNEDRQLVVDGQQRLLTLSLLANALYGEAVALGRDAVAQSLRSTYLFSLDYETNESLRRLELTDKTDDATFERLLGLETATNAGSSVADDSAEDALFDNDNDNGTASLADLLVAADSYLRERVHDDIKADPPRRLGQWAKFLEAGIRLAVFRHPDAESAYRVFEAINTRGRELTTADLLKSYVINNAPDSDRDAAYKRWREITQAIGYGRQATVVQFIRHAVTVNAGHIAPRDLYGFLTGKTPIGPVRSRRTPPDTRALLDLLQTNLPLYLQMIDPDSDGPAPADWVPVLGALSELEVISVRPILMAMALAVPDQATEGFERVLDLVVKRTVVGNLGTGNVERLLGEAALQISLAADWHAALDSLELLIPERGEFERKAAGRPFGRRTLAFLRRSQIQNTKTPESTGYLHLVRPRQATSWPDFPLDDFTRWGSTLGNTWMATQERRPRGSSEWGSFKSSLAPLALNESLEHLDESGPFNAEVVETRGITLGRELGKIWYGAND